MTYRTDRADGDQLTPNDDEMVQDRQAVRDDDDALAADDGVITRDDDELVPVDDQVVLRGEDDEDDDDEPALADGRVGRDDDELVPVHGQVVPGDDQQTVPQDDEPAAGLAASGLAEPQDPSAFDAGELAGQPETGGIAAADGTATAAAVPALDSDVPAAASDDMDVPAAGAESGSSALPAAGPDRTSLGVRWHEIQAMFVDDPRTSVELAAGMVDDSTEAFVASIRERQQSLLSVWQGSDTDTEGLRTALQGYRAFWNRLEDFSSES